MLCPNLNTACYFTAKYFGGRTGQGAQAMALPCINHNQLGYGQVIVSYQSLPAGYTSEMYSLTLNSYARTYTSGQANASIVF